MTAVRIGDSRTPALLVEADSLEHNLAAMAAALPGARCRPHVGDRPARMVTVDPMGPRA